MDKSWISKWDERYAAPGFAYGEQQNHYLREQLERLAPGSILFPAEGEGRSAVFAAKLGWNVSAFDISNEGKKKALWLAEKNNVSIDYQIGELSKRAYHSGQFDAIALIYAHFPAAHKSLYHKTMDYYLSKNGLVIFEAFSKRHLEYLAKDKRVGGPGEIDMLFSTDELRSDFPNYDIIELVETEIELSEGRFHSGKGSVIRFVGRKK